MPPLSLFTKIQTPEYCGSPRTLTIDFTCPKDASALIPTAWNATNPEGTCDFIYNIPTCAVCKGGCSGGGWGAMFLILLLGVCLPVYLIAGMIYNYVKREYRGKELCNGCKLDMVVVFFWVLDSLYLICFCFCLTSFCCCSGTRVLRRSVQRWCCFSCRWM